MSLGTISRSKSNIMSNRKPSSLEELLLASDLEITGTQANFTDIVFKFENIKWNDAQRKAAYLLKAGEALNYLQDVRAKIGVQSGPIQSATMPQLSAPVTSPALPVTVIPMEKNRNVEDDIFQENYKLLCEFAPELEKELYSLQGDTVVSGSSSTSIHGTVSIRSMEKDKYGYYLELEVDETAKPLQIIELYENLNEKTVRVLSCESTNGRFDVYDDKYIRSMVDPVQSETQNTYLNSLLKRLIGLKLIVLTVDQVIDDSDKQEELERENRLLRRQLDHLDSDFEYMAAYKETLEERVEDLEERNAVLKLEIEELREKSSASEKKVDLLLEGGRKKFRQQTKTILGALIPKLSEELQLASFEVSLETKKDIEGFDIRFEKHDDWNSAVVYHSTTERAFKRVCIFSILETGEVALHQWTGRFFGMEETINVNSSDEISENSLAGDVLLFEFVLALYHNEFKATIKNRVYEAQEAIVDTKAVKTVENSSDDGVATVLAVLGLLAGGLLGFKALRS